MVFLHQQGDSERVLAKNVAYLSIGVQCVLTKIEETGEEGEVAGQKKTIYSRSTVFENNFLERHNKSSEKHDT